MTKKRAFEIFYSKEIKDIYFNDNPIWIQEINNNKAKVGFLDSKDTKDIYINEIYERNL